MTDAENNAASYVLATGERAISRLDLLDAIFGPSTHELLLGAGLEPGMRVAEIGCGTGLTSLWIAAHVPGGTVTAVDVSEEQLQVAKQNAQAACATNISFHQASAYDKALPRDSFDLVYSRFLLCHLADPGRALAEMRALLKPQGVLVAEDHDHGGIFTEPPTRAYLRLVEISERLDRERGLDSYVGLKLPQLFRSAGFAHPEARVHQMAYLRGREKRFWEITLQEAAPAILAAGASTPEELESICSEMRGIAGNESILLMLARVTQGWARK